MIQWKSFVLFKLPVAIQQLFGIFQLLFTDLLVRTWGIKDSYTYLNISDENHIVYTFQSTQKQFIDHKFLYWPRLPPAPPQ